MENPSVHPEAPQWYLPYFLGGYLVRRAGDGYVVAPVHRSRDDYNIMSIHQSNYSKEVAGDFKTFMKI